MQINKSMDRADLETPEAIGMIDEIVDMLARLREKGLKASAWTGSFDLSGDQYSEEVLNRGIDYKSLAGSVDDVNFPWFLYWEIVWVLQHGGFEPGQTILDLGGSSSLFSYYVADKGFEVTAIDRNQKLVDNGNLVAEKMGWNLSNIRMDMRDIQIESEFDHITSICVYEHIPYVDRIEINKTIKEMLKRGGRFSITFDYKSPSRLARINSPEDIHEQFVLTSGLRLRGNHPFYDVGKNYLISPFYHPRTSLRYKIMQVVRGHFRPWELFRIKTKNEYTFGALFQEKPL